MGQQVKIYRDLEFLGNASHTGNIKGNISVEKVVYVDHFQKKAIDTTFDWNSNGQSAGAPTHEAPHIMKISTGTQDDDEWAVSTGLNYRGQYNSIFEVRARNSDVTGLQFFIGFADATYYSNKIAFAYSGTTLDSECADGVGFVFDPDANVDYVYGVSVKNTADGEDIFSTAHTLVNDIWFTCRVELVDNGTTTNAFFYFNKTGAEINPITDLIGMEADAVTRTDPLCLTLAVMNFGAGTDNIDVDYVKTWSDPQ